MKLNTKAKALVAAVALAAFAGQAGAALTAPTTTTGQSDLVFFAIDLSGGKSFVYDLGSSAVLPTLNQNITGAAWTSYLTAEGNDLSNTTWGLAYIQGTTASTSQWGTTVTVGNTIGTETAAKMNSGRSAFNAFGTLTAISSAGTSAFSSSGAADNYTVGLANSFGGNTNGFTVDNVVGATADFYIVSQANSALGGNLLQSGVTFDGTNVQVAAVPEPETYGMLAAGLLMLGAMVRRRKQG